MNLHPEGTNNPLSKKLSHIWLQQQNSMSMMIAHWMLGAYEFPVLSCKVRVICAYIPSWLSSRSPSVCGCTVCIYGNNQVYYITSKSELITYIIFNKKFIHTRGTRSVDEQNIYGAQWISTSTPNCLDDYLAITVCVCVCSVNIICV